MLQNGREARAVLPRARGWENRASHRTNGVRMRKPARLGDYSTEAWKIIVEPNKTGEPCHQVDSSSSAQRNHEPLEVRFYPLRRMIAHALLYLADAEVHFSIGGLPTSRSCGFRGRRFSGVVRIAGDALLLFARGIKCVVLSKSPASQLACSTVLQKMLLGRGFDVTTLRAPWDRFRWRDCSPKVSRR